MSQVEIIFNENVILRLSFVIFTKNGMPHKKGLYVWNGILFVSFYEI